MRALLVDDEPKNVRILKTLLQNYCPQVNIIGEAGDAEAAFAAIKTLQPELVFLDIEMPHGNAFDLLNKLMPVNFEVIFITAFDNYSLKAFKYSALDYLLKPVDIEELKAAVNKAMGKIHSHQLNHQIEYLISNFRGGQSLLQKIALPTADGIAFLNVDDIIRCEANGNYTYFYLGNKDKVVASKNIKEYEDILPANIFCRIHNSHIINLNRVKKYHKGRGGYIIMEDGSNLEVASRRRDEFLAKFGQ
jgi:two-component system, LytTR family, response regulator